MVVERLSWITETSCTYIPTKCRHCLPKDVDAHHMELMLSYMYRGEITVKETELVALLNTASDLQVFN